MLGLSTIFVAFYGKNECYQEGWKTYRFPSKSVWKTKKREKGKKKGRVVEEESCTRFMEAKANES